MGRTQSIDLRHSSPEVSPTLKPYSAGPQFLAMKQVPLKPASPRSPVPVSLSGSEEKAVQPYAPMNNSAFVKHRLIGLEHYRHGFYEDPRATTVGPGRPVLHRKERSADSGSPTARAGLRISDEGPARDPIR